MRFAITCTDRYLGVFQTLVQAGWTPAKLFTTEVDHHLHEHRAVLSYAAELGIDVRLSRLDERELAALAADGVETLVVASYNWRIPDWRAHLRYAINFHPSPLPQGRGPYPQVAALLRGEGEWGVSCHQLGADFDTGPVLAQERFPLDAQECHDTLDLKIQLAAKRLAQRVASDLPGYWAAAQPQSESAASYQPHWQDTDRLLDFRQPLAVLERQLRAFGRIECLAQINEVTIFVHRAQGWREAHAHRPGAVVHRDGDRLLVAVADGYLAILEWSLLSPDARPGNIRR